MVYFSTEIEPESFDTNLHKIYSIEHEDGTDEIKKLFEMNPLSLHARDPVKGWLPIHHAASKGKINIISFILSKSDEEMIDSKDSTGNTPLHVSIENNQLECTRFLLLNKADYSIQNNDNINALFYCVYQSKPEILDLMLAFKMKGNDKSNTDGSGLLMHHCALLNNLECAKILSKHGINFCRPCPNGFYPIHLAITRGSREVFEYLIQESSKNGSPISKNILTLVDSDFNTPLHIAVQFDNLEGVKICLQNGSRLDDINELEKTTPIHIACSQGSLSLLEYMFKSQPELINKVINMQDINLMTPLHKACMFDYIEIVDFLIKNGASLETLDEDKRTPLLLAASRNCLKTVFFLLNKANVISQKDSKLRNIIHLMMNQDNLALTEQMSLIHPLSKPSSDNVLITMPKSFNQIVLEILKNPNCIQMLNEQDLYGCTVMHYACQHSHKSIIPTLIKYGAQLNTPNREKQCPLHFAAKYGCLNSCVDLLASDDCKKFINQRDDSGRTALHLAALNGHAKVVKLLMKKGALIYRSYIGDTPFHLAAVNNHIECMNVILNVNFRLIDLRNGDGDTALQIAARKGHAKAVDFLLTNNAKFDKNDKCLTFIDQAIIHQQKEVLLTIIAHKRWQEALDLDSQQFKKPILGLIEFSEEITQAVLDRCITKKNFSGTNSKKYTLNFDFKYLIWSDETKNKKGKSCSLQMPALQHMIKNGRTECLSHPLCEKLLIRKWNRYGIWVYGLTIIAKLIFLAMLTLIVSTYPSCNHDDLKSSIIENNLTFCDDELKNQNSLYNKLNGLYLYQIMSAYCILYSIMIMMIEMYFCATKTLHKIITFHTTIQAILFPSTIIFLVPIFISTENTYHFQWQAGTIAIFVAWFNLLIYLQKFQLFGIYIVMFTDILKTLLKVVILFSILLIGFGLAFYILMKDNKDSNFTTPFFSIFRIIVMMLGELDGLNSYAVPYNDQSNITLHYSDLSLCFLILFILLVPILLINLLIGLAVGDIGAVLKDAKLKRQEMQIQHLVNIEEALPARLLEKVKENMYSINIDEDANQDNILSNTYDSLTSESPQILLADKTEELNKFFVDELTDQKQRLTSIETSLNGQMEYLQLIMQKL